MQETMSWKRKIRFRDILSLLDYETRVTVIGESEVLCEKQNKDFIFESGIYEYHKHDVVESISCDESAELCIELK